jgi:hypothetical protein
MTSEDLRRRIAALEHQRQQDKDARLLATYTAAIALIVAGFLRGRR